MRKLLQYGFIGLGIYVLYTIYNKANAVGNLKFTIGRIGYSVDSLGVNLTFYVKVANAEAASIGLNSMRGDLVFNGSKCGTFTNDIQIQIQGNQVTLVPISVQLPYGSVADVLMNLIDGKTKKNSSFELNGTATIDGVPLPVSVKYSLY